MNRELINAWNNYQNSLTILEMERSNVETSKKNFEYTKEKYELGQVDNITFRQAQLNLLLTRNSLNNVGFNTKLAELEVLRLSGQLLVQEQN